MANTAIGEIGVHVDGQSYTLRPSFLAMQKIGQPEDIEATMLFCGSALMKQQELIAPSLAELAYCLDVIEACAVKPIPAKVFGQLVEVGDINKYQPGEENQETLVIVANALLKSGVHGKPDPKRLRKAKPDEKFLFDPIEFVSVAMSPNGFNKSSDDAWQMTMVEFQRVFDATFPLTEKEKNRMSQDEARDLLKRLGKLPG